MTLLKMYFRAHTGSLISQPSNDHQQQQHRPEAAEVQKELGTGLFFITRLRAKITDYMCSKAKNIKDFKLWLALLQKKKKKIKFLCGIMTNHGLANVTTQSSLMSKTIVTSVCGGALGYVTCTATQ